IVKRTSVKVSKGAVLQHVRIGPGWRKVVVRMARADLVGLPYNSNFTDNKQEYPTKVNCSGLVWNAYYYGTGHQINLDSNHISYAPGVYPYDIKFSKYTHTYRTVT
ncbi:MAG TPA: hypothetical protein VF426_06475, partial [Marmoricola sp.]